MYNCISCIPNVILTEKNKYNVPVHPGYFVLLEILRYTVSVCTGTNYTYL